MFKMSKSNVKMALAAIRAARWRSLMTMCGVIIGIVSVVTTVSIGEGARRQVDSEINRLGSDLITINPGRAADKSSGGLPGIDVLPGAGASTLNEQDLRVIQQTPNVKAAAPLGLVTGVAEVGGRQLSGGRIIATNEDMAEILNQPIEFGGFFGHDDASRAAAVIGKRVAEQLFQENVPVGKSLQIRGQEFIVRGVFEEFATSPLVPGSDYNSTVFIPYEKGKELSGDTAQLYQILARPVDAGQVEPTISLLRGVLLAAHGGQEDFSVLKQSEALQATGNILTLLTSLIAGVAGISLLVGGIGIMNIMLVSVTERTHEIGIRKAVGATNLQILGQFLTEAVVLSLVGGLIGVLLAGLANFLIRITTGLQPIITLPIVAVACAVSLLVGIIFGVTPALKAARKDPIEALRH